MLQNSLAGHVTSMIDFIVVMLDRNVMKTDQLTACSDVHGFENGCGQVV